MRNDLGFLSSPANGLGIVRARTLLGNIRLWDIPRSRQALAIVVQEIGRPPIPALYILLDERKVYIGQTEDIAQRIESHILSPIPKIQKWERALIFNDGRSAPQSDLNDENLRLALEDYLVQLFKINRYQVITLATRSPNLSSTQVVLVSQFKDELNLLLSNKGKITRFLTGRFDDEMDLGEVKRLLQAKGHRVQDWGEKYATIDDQPVIIRPGSQKPRGWQVTFRGSKSLAQLMAGEGFLLMPRGRVVLLPLREIRDFVLAIDGQAFSRDTVDVFIRFEEHDLFLAYKGGEKSIASFLLR